MTTRPIGQILLAANILDLDPAIVENLPFNQPFDDVIDNWTFPPMITKRVDNNHVINVYS